WPPRLPVVCLPSPWPVPFAPPPWPPAPPPPPPPPAPPPAPPPTPAPTPLPTPTKTQINSDVSMGSTVTDLGSNFLERLNNQATNGFERNARTNPLGGGASEAAEGPRYRTWSELYGIRSTTGPQADYFCDKRRTI